MKQRILSAEIAASAVRPEDFPKENLPEIAFLGRSNVGKSSLLNALVQRRKLAYTSQTPGKTRLVHFYRVRRTHGELLFVDLPGYGYAKVPKAERRRWGTLVESYLEERKNLCLAVLLQDIRRDFSDDERDFLPWLAERGISALVVLTKSDKLSPPQRAKRARELETQLSADAAQLLVTSASRGLGVAELWKAIEVSL